MMWCLLLLLCCCYVVVLRTTDDRAEKTGLQRDGRYLGGVPLQGEEVASWQIGSEKTVLTHRCDARSRSCEMQSKSGEEGKKAELLWVRRKARPRASLRPFRSPVAALCCWINDSLGHLFFAFSKICCAISLV